jgi:hypothetical protein
MAIKALNSVGGFSVGENPSITILANGDITTGNANLTGNLIAANILTDNYRYANGNLVDFQQTAGNTYEIQFNNAGNFDANPNLLFNSSNNYFYLNGNANITGNADIGNINVIGVLSALSNIYAPYFVGNFSGNITGNVTIPGDNTSVVFNDAGTANSSNAFTFDKITNTVSVSNTLCVTGNIFSGNANLGNLALANYFNGTLVTSSQPNITSLGNLTSLNIDGVLQGNIVNVTSNINALGNIEGGNLRTNGSATLYQLIAGGIYYPLVDGTPGQVLVTDGNAQLGFATIDTFQIANGNSNVVVNSNANVTISSNGVANVVVVTGNGIEITGNANITGDANLGNLNANIISASGNVTGSNVFTSGEVSATGNLSGNNIGISQLLTTGNANITGYVLSNLVPGTGNALNLGDSGFYWNNAYINNTIFLGNATLTTESNRFSTANANLTGNVVIQDLTVTGDSLQQGNVTISGNLVVSGNTTYINVDNLSVKDPLITLGGNANGTNVSAYDGKDRGLVLFNYYPNGSGPLNQAFIWKTSNNQFEALNDVVNFNSELVTANGYANIKANVFVGNISGSIITSNQSNITEVGTLVNLSVTGNITTSNTGNFGTLIGSNLTYPNVDGSAGQVIQTYGNGLLYFATPVTNALINGNSNVTVESNSNITISANGVSNVFTVTSIGGNVTGTFGVSSNLTANNLSANYIVGVGLTQLNWATKTTTGTTANQIIANVPTASIRGAEFFVKGEESLGGKYSISTLAAVHDSSGNVDYTNFNTVVLGGATGILRVIYDSGNMQLVVTPASSNSTVWTTQYRTI